MPTLTGLLWWIVLGVLLGWMASWMFNRTLRTRVGPTSARGAEAGPSPAAAQVVERIVERPVERIVEKPVERIVEVAVERIVERPVERIVERIVERPGERVVTVERTVADTAALEARDRALRRLRDRVAHLDALVGVLSDRIAERPVHELPPGGAAPAVPAPRRDGLDLAAATAAGFAPRHVDDLEIVEGIGPRIATLLRAEGIATWRALAACSPARLRDVLDLGGPGFRIADPGSWPEQAALAADDRWAELRALQDRLVAGRR